MTTWHEMLDSIAAEEKKNPPPKGEGGAAAAEGKERATDGGEPVKGEAAAAPKESPLP